MSNLFEMSKLFGFWEMRRSIVIGIYIFLVLAALAFIGWLFMRFRKAGWAFLISAALALFIAAFLPLIMNEIVFAFTELDWSNVSPTAMTILDSLSGGALALIARRILAAGFDVTRLEWKKQ